MSYAAVHSAQSADQSAAQKAALRKHLLATRRALHPEVREVAAKQVRAALLAAIAESGARTVAGYVPFGVEPGGPDLPAALVPALPAGGRLLLPVLLEDRALDWVRYPPAAGVAPGSPSPSRRPQPSEPQGGDDVGRLGRRAAADRPGAEPADEPRLGRAAIGEADLVIVPALAVDRQGVRLGRGGGSYDRALTLAAPDALVVALLHDGELREDPLPAAPHDRRVAAVITPGMGLVRLPAA